MVAAFGGAVATVAIAAVSWLAFKPTELTPIKEAQLQEPTPKPLPGVLDSGLDENNLKGDYSQLQKYLQQKNWEAADQETFQVMLKVAGLKSEEQGRFNLSEWEKFSCQDFNEIDRLWSEASNGRLGFSTQNRILEESKNYNLFYEKIGWIQESPPGNSWVVAWNYNPETKKAEYLPQQKPNFENPPDGHLPAKLEWDTPEGGNPQDRRFEAIYKCKL
ncbi:MAG: GUN4 domain-containing protein [Symploca sp. SIO3C6]|nr:GUN4 domain-containing protein [Symploca sp. SIO3C6]